MKPNMDIVVVMFLVILTAAAALLFIGCNPGDVSNEYIIGVSEVSNDGQIVINVDTTSSGSSDDIEFDWEESELAG